MQGKQKESKQSSQKMENRRNREKNIHPRECEAETTMKS